MPERIGRNDTLTSAKEMGTPNSKELPTMSLKLTSEKYDRQVSIHLRVLLKEPLPEIGEALKILEAIPLRSPHSPEHRAAFLRVVNASFAIGSRLNQFAAHIDQLSQRSLSLERIVLNKYAPVWNFDPSLPQIPSDNVLSLFLTMCWEIMRVYEFISFTPPPYLGGSISPHLENCQDLWRSV